MKWTNPLEWLKLSDEDEEDGDVVEISVIEPCWEREESLAQTLFRMFGMLPGRF